MDIKKITDTFSTSPQITVNDLAALKAAGFKAVICNRPDGEGANQPAFADIAAAASKAGLEARHVPVRPGMIGDQDVAAFGAALAALPGPVLGYCLSGGRAAALWSAHQALKVSSR